VETSRPITNFSKNIHDCEFSVINSSYPRKVGIHYRLIYA